MNPVVETQLIVDHSLAVEHAGFDSEAFDKNRAIEERRNEDRFQTRHAPLPKSDQQSVEFRPLGSPWQGLRLGRQSRLLIQPNLLGLFDQECHDTPHAQDTKGNQGHSCVQ